MQQLEISAVGSLTVALNVPELAAGMYLVETSVAGQPWRSRWVKPRAY
ncbi:hypothetical protein [Hymenobacter terricola]|nr:hypothetical protein [Hymenobacter terricola]